MVGQGLQSKQRVSIWKFILTYVVLMGLTLLLIGLEPVKKVVDLNGLYTSMIIYFSTLLLKPFGVVQNVWGSVIDVKGTLLDVKFGCNGLEAFLIYTVGILSFPAAIRKKAVGVAGGFVVLQLLNVMRIAGLGLTGVY